ncbi:sensor histidine kinase [Actinotalea solisilvae]|uniref:sensor histidine kinase n=1 Tax=Actinotalea solisilvae TaxID=2072922 RepID=UPI0027DE216E|nr:HAMP domain-containing sensor histidine kinase [Actinotalea solisilvae]
MRWTLRRRLVAVLVGLLVTVAAVMGAVSTLALRGSLVDQLDEGLEASSDRALSAQDGQGDRDRGPGGPPSAWDDGDGGDAPPPGLDAPGQGAGTVNLTVDDGTAVGGFIDADGSLRRLTDAQVATLEDVEPDEGPTTVDLEELGRYRVLAATGRDGDLVVTGLSTAVADATVREYLVAEVLVAAAGITLAAVAGGALVRRELEPLERVASTAARVSELPLHEGEVVIGERVPERDTDPSTEVGQVGAALNRLLGHVEGALASRHESETQVRRFVADASHELRTPLASIRGYAELVRRMPGELPPDAVRAMERVESESRRMTTLVEDMLLLARLDAGRPLDRSPVDLTVLAVDAVADAHAAGPDHRWRLELAGSSGAGGVDGPDVDRAGAPELRDPAEAGDPPDDVVPDAVVPGDEDRLRQVLANLLANARVHTPAGTTVTTTVRRDGGSVVVEVADDGPGIPVAQQPTLFQRFTRGDAARSPGSGSTGLGLAIVDAVVRAHGGRLAVESVPGDTRVTVVLPAAPPSDAEAR